MSEPTRITDEQIKTNPKLEQPSDLRPGNNQAWTVESDQEPSVEIELTTGQQEPLFVGSITVRGNPEGVKISLKDSPEEDVEFKPLTTDGTDEPKVCAIFALEPRCLFLVSATTY